MSVFPPALTCESCSFKQTDGEMYSYKLEEGAGLHHVCSACHQTDKQYVFDATTHHHHKAQIQRLREESIAHEECMLQIDVLQENFLVQMATCRQLLARVLDEITTISEVLQREVVLEKLAREETARMFCRQEPGGGKVFLTLPPADARALAWTMISHPRLSRARSPITVGAPGVEGINQAFSSLKINVSIGDMHGEIIMMIGKLCLFPTALSFLQNSCADLRRSLLGLYLREDLNDLAIATALTEHGITVEATIERHVNVMASALRPKSPNPTGHVQMPSYAQLYDTSTRHAGKQLETLRDVMHVNVFAGSPHRIRVASRRDTMTGLRPLHSGINRITRNTTPAQRVAMFVDRLVSMVDYFVANLVLLRQDPRPDVLVCVVAVQYVQDDEDRCVRLFPREVHHGTSTKAPIIGFVPEPNHMLDIYLCNFQHNDVYLLPGSLHTSTVLDNDELITRNATSAHASLHQSNVLPAFGFAGVCRHNLLSTTATSIHCLQDANNKTVLVCSVRDDAPP